MKRLLKKIFPLLLAIAIIASIGWYLFEYDTGFTRDFLMHQAKRLEENGNHSAAVWMYNLVYRQFGGDDHVAVELAEQFKAVGNYSKAEYTLRNAIAKSGTPELYIALSKTYLEQGKIRDAVLMLENVNPAIQSQVADLRPKAPTASLASGTYNEYLSVDIRAENCKIYVSTDGDYPATTDLYTGPILLDEGETTVFAVCVAENGLVSSLAVFNYIVSDVVEKVNFVDPAFEAAVRVQLGYDEDRTIYSNDLWTLTELTLSGNITRSDDLRWLPNITALSIENVSLTTLNGLSTLDKLQKLSITDSIVSTPMLETIACVSTLTSLTLSDCAISSVSPLSVLNNLEYLDLSDNAIRDISGLAGMSKLTYLDLHSNALIHLDGMETLTAIEHLDVSFNSLVSTASIENLSHLQYLDLSSNALRSLEGVEQLSELTHFIARYNELINVDVLKDCQNLVFLDVCNNTLLDINVTASLASLEELYFGHNEVSQLPKYDSSCALRIISGEYNQLSSLKNLGGLQNLTHIYMDFS